MNMNTFEQGPTSSEIDAINRPVIETQFTANRDIRMALEVNEDQPKANNNITTRSPITSA